MFKLLVYRWTCGKKCHRRQMKSIRHNIWAYFWRECSTTRMSFEQIDNVNNILVICHVPILHNFRKQIFSLSGVRFVHAHSIREGRFFLLFGRKREAAHSEVKTNAEIFNEANKGNGRFLPKILTKPSKVSVKSISNYFFRWCWPFEHWSIDPFYEPCSSPKWHNKHNLYYFDIFDNRFISYG